MVTPEIGGGRDEVNAVIGSATGIAFAPTLGDIGSTLSHPASSVHRGLSVERRAAGLALARECSACRPELSLMIC